MHACKTKMLNARLSMEAHDILTTYMTEHNLSFKTEALEKILRTNPQVTNPKGTKKLKARIVELEQALKDKPQGVNEELLLAFYDAVKPKTPFPISSKPLLT